jgi:hypothetical protein
MSNDDRKMLRELVEKADLIDKGFEDDTPVFHETTRRAMRDIFAKLNDFPALTEKQRAYVRGVYEKVFDAPQYENLISSGKAPRGREVPTPDVLKNLPKEPPSRIRRVLK